MNILKNLKKKWELKKQQKEANKTLNTFGQVTLLEYLMKAMEPENYNIVKEKIDGKFLWKIVEKYSILDDDGNAIKGEYEWKFRFSYDADANKSGYFTTKHKAIDGLAKIIGKAATDFDEALLDFQSSNKDYDEVI